VKEIFFQVGPYLFTNHKNIRKVERFHFFRIGLGIYYPVFSLFGVVVAKQYK